MYSLCYIPIILKRSFLCVFYLFSNRNIGSAALSMAYVAQGIIDILYDDVFLKPWDVAAGTLLIREAGGTVIDSKGTIT